MGPSGFFLSVPNQLISWITGSMGTRILAYHMECPRCDGPVEAYTLEGTTAVVCQECGYVGVPADHRSVADSSESWDEAIERFLAQQESTANNGD